MADQRIRHMVILSLDDPDATVRAAAARTIFRGVNLRSYIPFDEFNMIMYDLTRVLSDSDAEVRGNAALAITGIAHEWRETDGEHFSVFLRNEFHDTNRRLRELLDNDEEDESVRDKALRAIRMIEDPSELKWLKEFCVKSLYSDSRLPIGLRDQAREMLKTLD